MNNWNSIRDFYKANMDNIMSVDPLKYGVDPYWWDGLVEMTPIEKNMWHDIRCTGAVFYPQFPILGFFVDFANPQMKIAIECDGKNWHDPVKDAKRDAALLDIGWTVFRFTGKECNELPEEEYDENNQLVYKPSPAERLLSRIRQQATV